MTMTGGKCDECIRQQRLTEFSPFLRRCCPSVGHCCHLGSEGPHTLGPQTPRPSAISAHPSHHRVAPALAECTLRRTRAKSALGICTAVSWWEHQRQWCALWCCRCTGSHWPHSVQSLEPLKKKRWRGKKQLEKQSHETCRYMQMRLLCVSWTFQCISAVPKLYNCFCFFYSKKLLSAQKTWKMAWRDFLFPFFLLFSLSFFSFFF